MTPDCQTPDGPTGDWTRTLDDCEARLDAASAPLEAGATGTEITAFDDPAVTGPLPVQLVGRAQAIVERGEALERRLTGEQEQIRAELRRLPRMPPAPRRSRFDTRA